MRPVVFNGKFYGATLNGVHRVADRLIREVDALLARRPVQDRPAVRLIVPAAAGWVPPLQAIEVRREPGPTTQLWEQVTLPRRAAGAVLVNLCNLAPIAHGRKILLVHDAQFLFPDSSYPARLRWGYRLLIPLMARTSAQVLTVSHYSRQILDLVGISPAARTAILYNGVDHMLDATPAASGGARFGVAPGGYVVIFGSAKRYKNVEVVFDAFRDPRLSGLRLVVIGPERPALEAAGLAPPDAAVFVGHVDDATLRTLYSEALCIAFPSRTEGFGLPPAEAAFCGCPAVVAPAGAIPEICADAVLYAGVDAPAEWADAIHRYATDPDLRARKAAAGQARAAQFPWSKAGSDLLAHIERLASRS